MTSVPDLADRVALYLCADILFARPTIAGSTMPALEFVAAARDDTSLVLDHRGRIPSALSVAYSVNGDDPASVRAGLVAAMTAAATERAERIATMRDRVTGRDVYAWVGEYLASLRSAPVARGEGRWRPLPFAPAGSQRRGRSAPGVHFGGTQ